MFRRVKKTRARQQMQTPSVFIGRVGGPVPAPRSGGNGAMPSMDMNMNIGISGMYGGGYPRYEDRGLDDFRALHYYGLDNFDNIDF